MTDSSLLERTLLRRTILALRNQMPQHERAKLDSRLSKRLLTLPAIQNMQIFFVYCSYQSEVSTEVLINQLLFAGKTVCVPLTHPNTSTMDAVVLTCPKTDLIPGYKGIPEPIPSLVPEGIYSPEQLEVVLIPGSVFDLRGYRLGYGGGYYDRFLALSAPNALRIGLAYAFQVVAHIPQQPYDVPMDLLVTEKDILSWSRGSVPGADQLPPENR
ncbi:MAG: 5-formyltetrahydrofolate cyclo-ligase [Desulfobulbus sp.]